MTIQEQIDRLRNRRTAYELIADNGVRNILVCYSTSRSRQSLWQIATKRAEHLASLTGTDVITFASRSADGATMGDWRIRWSGRTQIQALQEGAYPYVGSLHRGVD